MEGIIYRIIYPGIFLVIMDVLFLYLIHRKQKNQAKNTEK